MIERARLKKLIQSIDNKYFQDCLAQFTKEVDVTKSKLYKDPIFESLLENFNLEPIPISVILEQSEFIKRNPHEAIPKILQFQRNIDASYFMVMIQLIKPGFAQYYSKECLDILFPQLYRCLAMSSYQIDLIPIANGKETGFIPSTFIRALIGFVNMIINLPDENALSFAVVIQQILKQISKQLPEALKKGYCKTFIDDMFDLSSSISVVLFSKRLNNEYENAFLTYQIKVNTTFLINKIFTIQTLPFLNDFESTLSTLYSNNHIKDNSISHRLVEMVSTSLTYIIDFEKTDKNFRIAEILFRILMYLERLNNCDINKLAQATTKVLHWMISKIITIPAFDPGPNEIVVYEHAYNIECTDFVTVQTINNDLIKADLALNIGPVESPNTMFTTLNNGFIKLVYTVAEKCPTFYCDLVSQISVFLKTEHSPSMQLFLVDFMCRMKQDVLSILFASKLPIEWSSIINKYSFSTYVIMKKAEKLYIELNAKVIELIQKSFMIESKEAMSIALILCQYLRTNSPPHIETIVKLFYSISKRNPTQLSEVVIEYQVIPMLIQIDLIYKYQITKGDKNKSLIDIHTYVLMVFAELTKILEFNDNLVRDSICSLYILSLVLETKAEQISITFCRNLLKSLHSNVFMEKLRVFLEEIAEKGLDYLDPFTNLLECIRSSLISGNQDVALYFRQLKYIECICKAVQKFSETDGDSTSFFLLVSVSLNVFMAFCQTSNDNLISFNKASKLFNVTYCKAIEKTTLNEALADVLISLCLNETTSFQTETRPRVIKNTAALWLLYNLTKSSTLSDRIYAYLLAIISSSVENCYHCYICGFLMHIIKDMENFAPNILFQLIIIIGSHFCGIGELTAIFQQLRKTDQKFAPQLFDAIFNMFKTKMRIPLSTGFYVENQSIRYFTPAFHQLKKFKLCFSVMLKSEGSFNVIKISTTRESLIFCVGKTLLIKLCFDNSVIERTFSHPKTLNENTWNQIVCLYEDGFVKIYVDGITHDPPLQFDFTSDPIFFEHLDRERGAAVIESISITDIISRSDECMIFNHSVPFPLSFFDILPLAGGPQIFLPFFDLIAKSTQHQYLLIKCIQVISVAIKEYQDQVSPQFFRAFGHLLTNIKSETWTESSAKELKEIAEKLENRSLIIAMLQYIFLDFSIWGSLQQSIQAIFIKAINLIKAKHEKIFFTTFDFELLLVKFFKLINKNNTKNSFLVSNAIDILVSYPGITANSVMALFAISFCNNEFNEDCFLLTFATMHKMIRPFMTVLQKHEYYKPFLELAADQNERIRYWAIHIIYLLHNYLKKDDIPEFNTDMLFLARNYPRGETTDILVSILSFAFGEMKVFNSVTPMCTIQLGKKYTIKKPVFFVLFTSIAATSKINPKNSAEILTKTLQNSMESRNAIKNIPHWMFWLSLFFWRFSNQEEFGKTLALFAIDSGKDVDTYSYYSFLILACAKYNWDWSIVAGKFIIELLDNLFCKNTLKIVFLYLTLPHYFSVDKTLEQGKGQSYSLDEIIEIFFQKAQIPISFEFKNHYDDWTSDYTADIYTSILAHAVDNPKLFNMEIDFSSFHSISLINIITLLIDLYYDVPTSSAPSFCTSFISIFKNQKEIDVSLYTALYYMYTIKNLHKNDKEAIKQIFFSQGKNIIAVREIAFKSKTALQHLFETIIPDFQATVTRNVMDVCDTGMADLLSQSYIERLPQLKKESTKIYSEFFEQLLKHEEQLSRQNAKVWNRLWKSLQEDGGPWSVTDPKQYWKLEPKIDGYGRHYRLKKNRHFDKHEDASRQRDSGIKAPPPPPQEPFQLYAPKEIEFEATTFIHFECQMLTPTLLYKGSLHIYKNSIIFESSEALEASEDGLQNGVFKNKVHEIDISEISYVLNRRFMHIDNSCEIFTKRRNSYFFILPDGVRAAIYKKLRQMNVYCQLGSASKVLKDFKVVERWLSGKISNYYYLYLLNIISGRSFNDLNQYPVFPWVLKNYTSEKINLNDPENYRDFSKPMGAMDSDRLEGLLMIYKEINDPSMKCMYRVFYSSSAVVIGYLIRMEPFTSLHIRLQSGQFDLPGRLFWSLPDAFYSAAHESGDFRELIPEFFSLPAFLENQNGFDLGMIKYNEFVVNDVKLPPWAHSAAEFIHINRMALESPIVSSSINQWVDLIFGYKQRGPESEAAYNVYHPFSYPNIIDNQKIYSEYKNAINTHACNFGVVPSVLFDQPSPTRVQTALGYQFGTLFTPQNVPNMYEVASITFIGSSIATMTTDGKINLLKKIRGEFKPKRSIQFQDQFLSCFQQYKANLRILMATENIAILAAPTSNYFTIFDLSTDNANRILNSEMHPGTISALGCDTDVDGDVTHLYVASVGSDSSFFIYVLDIAKEVKLRSRMSSMFHKQAIIDVAVSCTYDLAATVDNSTLVYTSLFTGKVIVSRPLEFTPRSVTITELGYVLVVSETKEGSDDVTSFDLYDMTCNNICSKKRLGKCTAQAMFTNANAQEFLIVTFSDLSMAIMNIFDFYCVIQGELPKKASSITTDRANNCAIFSLDDGSVYVYDF